MSDLDKNENVENKKTQNDTNDVDNESQVNNASKNSFLKIKIIKIVIALMVILAILGIFEIFTGNISNIFLKLTGKKLEGNTIANIRNYGYIVSDNNYIYYMCPSNDGRYIGINKIKKDLKGEPERLIEGEWEITGLNIVDGYLYFITLRELEESQTDNEAKSNQINNEVNSDKTTNLINDEANNKTNKEIADEANKSKDKVDNKIHKIKIDGSNHKVINDNEFNNNCYEIYVIDNKVYYIGTDECIYHMDLDGNNKTKMNDNASGFIGITDEYIFYNMAEKQENSNEVNYATYVMDRKDGKNARSINGERLYNICVVGDEIYYINKDKYIYKIKIDGTENTMISNQTAYRINVTEEAIFYMNYYKIDGKNAGVAIYRMDLDGNNIKELKRMEEYSESLNIVDDWLFYTDSTDSEGKLELLSKDGKQTFILFTLDYLKVYYPSMGTGNDENLGNESS